MEDSLNNSMPVSMDDIVSCLKCTLSEDPCLLPTHIVVIFLILLVIILIFGTLGNLLIVVIVILRRKLQTVINFFIFNLAISDIASCLIGIPFNAWVHLFPQNWVLGDALCRIIPMVMSCCVCASTFTFIAIAIDRFCLVVFPLHTATQLGKRSCCVVIALIWFMSIVLCLPVAFNHTVTDFRWLTNTMECNSIWNDTNKEELYLWGLFSLQFVMPLVVVSITNTSISLKLSCNVAPGTMSAERQKRENSRRRHMNRMLSLVVLCFAFCWLPLSVFSLIVFYDKGNGDCLTKTWEMCGSEYITPEKEELFYYTAKAFDTETGCHNSTLSSAGLEGSQYTQTITSMATLTLAATNACFNPLLYAWMNENFMREFMRLFARVPGLRAVAKMRSKNCDYTSMNARSKQQSQVNTSCPVVETSFTAAKRSSVDMNAHDVQESSK